MSLGEDMWCRCALHPLISTAHPRLVLPHELVRAVRTWQAWVVGGKWDGIQENSTIFRSVNLDSWHQFLAITRFFIFVLVAPFDSLVHICSGVADASTSRLGFRVHFCRVLLTYFFEIESPRRRIVPVYALTSFFLSIERQLKITNLRNYVINEIS